MVHFFMRRVIAMLPVFVLFPSAFAAHIIGGELYYDHLGNDQYQVTLTLYRDCYSTGASFDPTGRIGVFDNTTGIMLQQLSIPFPGSTFIPVVNDSPCLTLPPDLCLETTSYVGVVYLPPTAAGYTLTFQRCCRQPVALNVVNPDDVGLTCTTTIPPQIDGYNSSPRFNALPPVALCMGEPLVFDHSATDPDGDDLVYALATPFTGGSSFAPYPNPPAGPPYTPIPWEVGYSETSQIDSDPPMSIDPVTGILTAQPSLVGNYVIGVSVKEYREGVLLSETIRDFLFAVVLCDATVIAEIGPQVNFCDGELTVDLQNNSIGGLVHQWDFGIPGITSDTSTQSNPTVTYPDFGTYTATLVLNPGEICSDTAQMTFELYPTPQPYFEVPDPSCGPLQTVLTAEGMVLDNSTIAWYLGWATPSFSSQEQVNVTFPTLGQQEVTLTITENGCTGSYTANVVAHPDPAAYFTPNVASPQPDGATIIFADNSELNGGNVADLVWLLNDSVMQAGGSTWTWENATPGYHQVTLSLVTAEGCTSEFTMTFMIIPEEIIIPNVFTPNNDGSNDLFVIENVQYYENDLKIFNRWGKAILDVHNYRNTWSAVDVPEGTYYYELHLADGREFIGHLTILR